MTRPPALLTHHAAQQGDTPISGVTLREYIATHAMVGLLSNPERHGLKDDVACLSVMYADALLAALAADREAQP